jgi:hypothetical protein
VIRDGNEGMRERREMGNGVITQEKIERERERRKRKKERDERVEGR